MIVAGICFTAGSKKPAATLPKINAPDILRTDTGRYKERLPYKAPWEEVQRLRTN
jgi:hypothetical protein